MSSLMGCVVNLAGRVIRDILCVLLACVAGGLVDGELDEVAGDLVARATT